MKQKKLLKQTYKARLEHDDVRLAQLRVEEFRKIFKRKETGKQFTTKWTIVQL